MSLEPWPPLHKLPEFRMRLLWLVIVGTVIVIVTIYLLQTSGGG